MKYFFIIILLYCCRTIHANGDSVRERININKEWHYQEGDPEGTDSALHYTRLKPYLLPCANDFLLFSSKHTRPKGNLGDNVPYTKPDFDDSSWRLLHLPHDWAIEKDFNIDYDSETAKLPFWGIGWYRKGLYIPQTDVGKRFYLDIDGAMSYASVWCNGCYVGGWPYGYASFRLDLTPYIKVGQSNMLAVRLENPKESSRWYPGGGLYRSVWLVKTSPVHVSQWGTYVRHIDISPENARMEMSVCLENHLPEDAPVSVHTDMYLQNKDGKPVGSPVAGFVCDSVIIRAGEKIHAVRLFQVENPKLWDMKSPNCYVAVTRVMMKGNEIDRYQTSFGIRDTKFTLNEGFFLNGNKVQIKGVCLHHDFGALGGAFNVVAAERQLRIMKEMGANAIRTSHNPPAPELVELCDRMGLLMQLELSDAWQVKKRKNDYGTLFDDWSEADMRSLVRHYRNHPSVIMWSIGNEVPEQAAKSGSEIAHRLTAYSHDEDPLRPTSYGCNRMIAFHDLANHVDIMGQNYNARSYGHFFKQNPTRRYHASETVSAISSRGEYFFPVTRNAKDNRSDFQLSSYDMVPIAWGCTPEEEFAMLEKYPAMYGEFVWTGFDYLGEPTPFNKDQTNLLNFSDSVSLEKARKELLALGKIKTPARSSYFGIVDLCGFPKDRYYAYKSYWRPEVPTLHILPHWNWEERKGKVTPVHIYTSGDVVELFLNGKSQGIRKKEHRYDRLTWDSVRYEPGVLKALAYKEGKKWAEKVVETTGKAIAIKAVSEKTVLKADGDDLAFIRVEIVDEKGRTVPRADNLLKFSLSGVAEIVAVDNGDATDLTPFRLSERKAYNGMALIILRSAHRKVGKTILTIKSEGLAKQEIELVCTE